MKAGDKARAEALKAEMGSLKDFIASGEEAEREIDAAARRRPWPSSPTSRSTMCRTARTRPAMSRCGAGASRRHFAFEPRQHFDIGEWLG